MTDVVKILVPTKPPAPAQCSLVPTLEADAWIRLIFDVPCFTKGVGGSGGTRGEGGRAGGALFLSAVEPVDVSIRSASWWRTGGEGDVRIPSQRAGSWLH